jgi:hypothetical protein
LRRGRRGNAAERRGGGDEGEGTHGNFLGSPPESAGEFRRVNGQ